MYSMMMRDNQRKVKAKRILYESLGSLLHAASKARVTQEQGISEIISININKLK